MLMPTEKQRVMILLHCAWDYRDDGIDDESIIKRLVDDGVPTDIANVIPGLIDVEIPKLIHDDTARQAIVMAIEKAIQSEDFEGLREVLLSGIDDGRTLHKMYDKLSELLLSKRHEKGTIAAFGLSSLPGLSDWPLIKALSNDDENVRFRAAFALGKMGKDANNALEPLRKATNDGDDYVREAAADALAAIEKDMKPWWKIW